MEVKDMVIISVKKEDLIRLLEVTLLETEQRKLGEKCCFDLILEPTSDGYQAYIEYFTLLDSDLYVEETCKIEYKIPAAVSFSNCISNSKILIGLVGINMQKIIDTVEKINNDMVKIRINPIEVDGILSRSIVAIEDLFPIVK
jgi:hypothetical protein